MQNIMNLQDFLIKNNLRKDSSGIYDFHAKIEYSYKLGTLEYPAKIQVRMIGYNGGSIHLEEDDTLTSDLYHLDFSEEYQKYAYNEEDNYLMISGESTKMKGKYTVKIFV
ncbi:hypothetical protein QLH32_04545 [Acinetobacter corruptisaponis]|uniref:Uncharacterized protein n=1 Tax=Acinetobacter corruptisaponis TaxID=3045147 RepID=A0ABY8S5C6_9GAMM|nr:hypothetical protein [Acinetobacter sp. KCTC 92772]WHP06745.1 hypothetical protein QLH32_04545 [Acinetobacter sp. KCTC 92772]